MSDRLSAHQQCDRYLKKSIKSADQVVVAWGNNGKLMQRDLFVLELLSNLKQQPSARQV
ncbi:DUF1643 domain-containing protein [Pseudanabaena sp. lw0831]|uniref:DUF1643 domain-containing protein n=1 Tax=Pseudanabaena sp. lw0831 TaxID=1357935 RepID=UPI001915119C